MNWSVVCCQHCCAIRRRRLAGRNVARGVEALSTRKRTEPRRWKHGVDVCTGNNRCDDARRVVAIFFPQAKVLGCEVDAECSPALQRKVVIASTDGRSYEGASRLLDDLAEVNVSTKQCQRITQRIGRARVAQRNANQKEFEQLPLPLQHKPPASAPANSWSSRVAVILMDGGRSQLRDERWGTPMQRGEKNRRWWREPKVACVATFLGDVHPTDPLPEIPACLLDPLWVVPRINEIKRARRVKLDSEVPGETDNSLNVTADDSADPLNQTAAMPSEPPDARSKHWSPPPLVRSVVATFGDYEQLGRLTQVEAWQRGFDGASRKAFLGDGHRSNWTIHSQQFSRYTPITDLLHAISYVYTAAIESSPDIDSAWPRYCRWATKIWQGRVLDVLAELEPLVQEATDPTSREKLQTSATFLRNNADRMRYDCYRQQGLPITTTLVEATIKQINRRMKGTEKFWEEGAEAQLQLCVDRLSDTDPLEEFWKSHASTQTGFCNRCAKP